MFFFLHKIHDDRWKKERQQNQRKCICMYAFQVILVVYAVSNTDNDATAGVGTIVNINVHQTSSRKKWTKLNKTTLLNTTNKIERKSNQSFCFLCFHFGFNEISIHFFVSNTYTHIHIYIYLYTHTHRHTHLQTYSLLNQITININIFRFFSVFFSVFYRFRISMETAGLPIPGYHYIAPNHIVKAPIHWMIKTHTFKTKSTHSLFHTNTHTHI